MQWRDDELLSDDVRNMLCGPGAPFEIVEEEVLGEQLRVFAQRPRSMREVMRRARPRSTATRRTSCSRDETVTYARAAAVASRRTPRCSPRTYGVGKGDRVAIASANTRRVHAHRAGPASFIGRDRHRAQRLVDRARARVRRGAHPAEGAVRRRAAPRSASPRWARSRRLPDGLRGKSSRRKVAARGEAPLPDTPTRRGRPGHHPVHERHDRAAEGRDAVAPQHHRTSRYSIGLRAHRERDARERRERPRRRWRPPASLCGAPFFHISGTAPLLMSGPFFGSRDRVPAAGPVGPGDAPRAHREAPHRRLVGRAHAVLAAARAPRLRLATTSRASRCVSSGGAPFPPELIRLLQETSARRRVCATATARARRWARARCRRARSWSTIPTRSGTPPPAIDVQIRDDDGNVLGEGEVGEICIRAARRVPRVLGQPRGDRRRRCGRAAGTAPATSGASTTACCSSRAACAT